MLKVNHLCVAVLSTVFGAVAVRGQFCAQVDTNGVFKFAPGTKAIDRSAFVRCTALKVVEIPASVVSVGDNAFSDAFNLERVTFAPVSQVISLGEGAFANTVNLKAIVLPNGLETLGTAVFFNSGLESIFIPSSITTSTTSGTASFFFENTCLGISPVAAALDTFLGQVTKSGNFIVCDCVVSDSINMCPALNHLIPVTNVTATSVTTTVAEGEECFLGVFRTVAPSVSSHDVCAEPDDNTSFRKLLVCQPKIFARGGVVGSTALIATENVMGIWTDAKYCMMLICGDDEDDYIRKVEAKVHKIEAGTVNDKALRRLLDCRICPDDYNFKELYGMYSFASALRMMDPPTRSPHYCRGYDACYPCGTEHIDKWPGITCNNGHVVGIKISGDKKYGSCCGKTLLPNKSCILKGEIPPQIHHLEHLQVLSLDKHLITGEIPPTIGNLQNLHTIQLSLNKMSGPLPKELYTLEHLAILDINDNHFVGTVHHEIDNMKALELLSLYNNQFDGEIPWSSLSVLERLYFLYLDGNVFDQQSCTREICNQVYYGDLHTFTVPPTVFCECATTV